MRLVLRVAGCGVLLAAGFVWACSQSSVAPLDAVGVNGNGGSCATPATGCACGTEGASVACGDVISKTSESVTCNVGTRTCSGGHWGACSGGKTTIKGAPVAMTSANGGGSRILDLQGMPTSCADDPCDPNCTGYIDSAPADAGSGLATTEAGITLAPAEGGVICSTTTISGTVYDPAGVNPIYSAYVYVPNVTPDPLPAGVTADKCGGGGTLSGKPYSVAVTGPDGKFTINNAQSGANVPLVIQIGKWRRQVVIPNVTPCAANTVDASLTRLPRNQSEGDIPQFAIATGGCDYLECLMQRIGIDSSEFTPPQSGSYSGYAGRVDYYQGRGGQPLAGSAVPYYDQLLGDVNTLKQYDVIVLPCECGNEYGRNVSWSLSESNAHQNIQDYTTAGGRMFTSHWGREWIENGPNPAFPGVATWVPDGYAQYTNYSGADPLDVYVDTSTLKGKDFKTWLGNVGTGDPFAETPTRYDVSSVASGSTAWLYAFSDNDSSHGTPDNIPDLSFNTPVGAAPMDQVGRVVYADTHVSANAVNFGLGWQFPDYCTNGLLDDQEKALEFLFFDLGACVSPINQPVVALYPNPATFTRDYEGVCPAGKGPVWQYFGWATTTPIDSTIVFQAASATTQAGLGAATPVYLGTASGAPILPYTGSYVDPLLVAAGTKSLAWLRITMTFNPSMDHTSAPTLNAWEQLYDCVDNQ